MKKIAFYFFCGMLFAATITARAQSGQEGDLKWSISDGTLTISGEGAMPDYGHIGRNDITTSAPWGAYLMTFNKLVIEEGITSIGSCAFSGCTALTSITISETITTVGSYAFQGCTGLTTINFNAVNCASFNGYSVYDGCNNLNEINIGNKVTTIPDYAFSGTLVTTVTIPEAVTSIGSYAFQGCTGLTSITIPEAVTSIGSYAFQGCTGLTTVNYNAINCTSFGYSVFSGCNNLTEINIGNGVTTIPVSAFSGCTGLTSITIPETITTIGSSAFQGCTGLTTVNYNAANCSSSGSIFDGCNNLNEINIGDGVKAIPDYAFSGCTGLASITIPESVTSIGSYAFSGCTGLTTVNYNAANCSSSGSIFGGCDNLKEINIGNKVTAIPNNAFSGTPVITVTIPESVTSIGITAFADCTSLTSITIPDALTSIGNSAFYNCTGLTTVNYNAVNCTSFDGYSVFSGCYHLNEINIGSEVTAIPDDAFYGTPVTTVNIGNSVTSIGNSAFYNCTGLSSVTIPEAVSFIGNFTFSDCTGLASVTIPEAITTIGNGAFGSCSSLTTVNFNATNCTSFGTGVFADCNNLTEINIGSKVTKIPAEAFRYCSALTSIVIPASVTAIGNYAFEQCAALTKIINQAANPQAINPLVFSNADKDLCKLFVPAGKEAAYRGSAGWRDFNNIEAIVPVSGVSLNKSAVTIAVGAVETLAATVAPDGATDKSVTWTSGNTAVATVDATGMVFGIAEGTAIITATTNDGGATANCTATVSGSVCQSSVAGGISGSILWTLCQNAASEDYTLIINGSKMQDYTAASAPWYAYSSSITDIEIGNDVTSIGSYAFNGCTGLTSVSIGSSTSSIGSNAFNGCTGLTSVTIPEAVNYIGNCAFSGCSALTTVDYNADSCSYMGYYASGGYNELGIPYAAIDNRVFSGCNNLATVNFGSKVAAIPNYAFYGCSGLTAVTIPEAVKYIGTCAFYGANITSLTIPEAVEVIGSCAFGSCSNLTAVSFNAVECMARENDIPDPNGILSSYTSVSAFGGCNLNNITFGSKVTVIPNYIFRDMVGLKSVTIPNTVESIGYASFYGSGLTSVTIPELVTSIENYAFAGCDNLTTINYNAVNCIGNANIINIPGQTGMFSSCNNATEVNIGSKVTVIPGNAFSSLASLTSVAIPESVTSIEESAFFGCINLTSVSIGHSVTSIGKNAFNGCISLMSVTNFAPTPQPINYSGNVFYGADLARCVLRAPANSIDDYRYANVWRDFGTLEALPYTSVVSGTVTGISNTVTVNLYILDSSSKSSMRSGELDGYTLLASTETNANGDYRFEFLPEGTYRVMVDIDGYNSESSQEISLNGGDTASDINFAVDENKGTVVEILGNNPVNVLTAKLYPNPTKGLFTLQFESSGLHNVTINNMAGRIMLRQTVNGQIVRMDISNYPAGVYLLTAENGNRRNVMKIVKN